MIRVCHRALASLQPSSFVRRESTATPPTVANFRRQAEHQNNPYKNFFQSGRKPRTYREKFIENIRNKPKPTIGDGTEAKHTSLIKRSKTTGKSVFYSNGNVRKATFMGLGLDERIVQQIGELGVLYPTSHQEEVIPVLREGKNCLYISPTGSGKTYTFLLPTIQAILDSEEKGYITRSGAPRAIIMAPTKELSLQIGSVVKHLIQDLPLRVLSLTEHSTTRQNDLISSRPFDIVVGTYERVTSLLGSSSLSLQDLEHLVVDEVGEWFDYRTIEERQTFLKELSVDGRMRCQVIMAGATLTRYGFTRAEECVPDLKQYLSPTAHRPLPHVNQRFFFVRKPVKPEHFVGFMKEHLATRNKDHERPLIFCNFKNVAYFVHKELLLNGINNFLISSDKSKGSRQRLMTDFIPRTTFPVVATESAANGLDFRNFGMVVNYEFPLTYDSYLRRMGRTGRLSTISQFPEVVSYVSLVKDKPLYQTVCDSTAEGRCAAYTMMNPNRTGWLRS